MWPFGPSTGSIKKRYNLERIKLRSWTWAQLVRPRSCSTLLAWSTFVERRRGAQCCVRVVVGSRFVSLHEVASKSILTPRICQHRFGPDRMNWLQTQDGCLMSSFRSLNIRFKRLNPRNFTRLRFIFWET